MPSAVKSAYFLDHISLYQLGHNVADFFPAIKRMYSVTGPYLLIVVYKHK